MSRHVELKCPNCDATLKVSQIMNLFNLAADIQEAILFLPRVEIGKDPVASRGS
jgi:hypothetical protein